VDLIRPAMRSPKGIERDLFAERLAGNPTSADLSLSLNMRDGNERSFQRFAIATIAADSRCIPFTLRKRAVIGHYDVRFSSDRYREAFSRCADNRTCHGTCHEQILSRAELSREISSGPINSDGLFQVFNIKRERAQKLRISEL